MAIEQFFYNPAVSGGYQNNFYGGGHGCGCGQQMHHGAGDIFGGAGPGSTVAGGGIGAILGLLLSSGNPAGALIGGLTGAVLGNIIGRHGQQNQHRGCCNQQQFPQAGQWGPGCCGNQFGGPSYGAYGNNHWHGGHHGHQGHHGHHGHHGHMDPYQQGYAHGQYARGYHDGYHAGQHGHGQHCPPHRGHCNGRNPGGELCQDKEGGPIKYTTSGGYNVEVDGHTIKITDPSGEHTVEHWGDPHEKVNGKHVKDWEDKQRSILLPDGTKITMSATGPQGVTTNTSIYDGDQNIQINNKKNEVTHRSFNPYDTYFRDKHQHDGETAIMRPDNCGGLFYGNLYHQGEDGSFKWLFDDLAYASDGKVQDFYDDPRLKHT